jgi:transposase
VIQELLPDGLWERVEPLLPPPRRHRYPGRRPIGERAALAGIMFMLKTGIARSQLPTGLAGCSGVTCWRRLRDWTEGRGVACPA